MSSRLPPTRDRHAQTLGDVKLYSVLGVRLKKVKTKTLKNKKKCSFRSSR